MSCISCSVIDAVQNTGLQFAGNTFGALSQPARNLLSATCGLVFMWKFVTQCLRGAFDWWGMIIDFMLMFIAAWMIASPANYQSFIQQPMTDLIYGVAGLNLSGTGQSADLTGVAQAVESNFGVVINSVLGIWNDAGWKLHYYLLGALLMVPYLIQLVVFIYMVAWAIGLTLVPYALGPFFIISAVFPMTRRLFFSSLDMYLSSFMVLSVATFLLALTTGAAKSFTSQIASAGIAPDFLVSQQFWGAVIVGLIGDLLLMKTEVIAAYVTNRIDMQRATTSATQKATDLFKKAFGK